MRLRRWLVAVALTVLAGACRTGTPVIDPGPKPPHQDGTIAGSVRTDGGSAVVSRIVRVIEVSSGQKYETTTNNAGTYTLKVPPGRYRLEVEVRPGEKVTKQPGETQINRSDLDPDRDFIIGPGD